MEKDETLFKYKEMYEGKSIRNNETNKVCFVRLVAVNNSGFITCFLDCEGENKATDERAEFIEKYYTVF